MQRWLNKRKAVWKKQETITKKWNLQKKHYGHGLLRNVALESQWQDHFSFIKHCYSIKNSMAHQISKPAMDGCVGKKIMISKLILTYVRTRRNFLYQFLL